MSDSEEKDISPVKKDLEESGAEDEQENGEEEMDTSVKDEETKEESPSKKSDESEEETPTPKKSTKTQPEPDQEDEDEEEESDEEPRLGLLEKPVVIESGKREKKKVERLTMQQTVVGARKKVEIGVGSGEKLGDIPRVEHFLQKTKNDRLKPLHKLLFGREGKINEIKKNIRQFNGFAFQKDDKEYEKKCVQVSKFTLVVLKGMCEILDIERGGTKEDIRDRLMAFCLNPQSSGKNLPGPKRRKSNANKGVKRKRQKKEKSTKSETKAKKTKKTEDSDEDEEEDKSDTAESKEESEEEDSVSEEEEAPKKKKARIESPKKPKKKPEKKKPAKKETPQKSKAQKKKELEESSSDSDEESEDDEPLIKKKKDPPTNDELKTLIKKILEKANLEELTMKSVIKQVHGKFPDFDLSDRKDFMKKTVRSLIT